MLSFDMYNALTYSYIILFAANGINSVWSTAVNRFNEAGCVKWVPHTSETHFVEVVGNSAR